MKKQTQKDLFLASEGDQYFARNKEYKYKSEDDTVLKVLQEYKHHPERVLEVGCNMGYRLDAISSVFPETSVTGIEPSLEAVTYGRNKYPQINFVRGTADDMSCFGPASFDLIIVGFVFYVVDREMLFKVISEIDRLLTNGGVLMIIDFFSEKPRRNPYTHIKEIEAFAFKQNYEEIFVASQLYHLLDKRSMNHTAKGYDLSGDYYDKYSLSTLRKDITASYK